jgi:hypothetical protein
MLPRVTLMRNLRCIASVIPQTSDLHRTAPWASVPSVRQNLRLEALSASYKIWRTLLLYKRGCYESEKPTNGDSFARSGRLAPNTMLVRTHSVDSELRCSPVHASAHCSSESAARPAASAAAYSPWLFRTWEEGDADLLRPDATNITASLRACMHGTAEVAGTHWHTQKH